MRSDVLELRGIRERVVTCLTWFVRSDVLELRSVRERVVTCVTCSVHSDVLKLRGVRERGGVRATQSGRQLRDRLLHQALLSAHLRTV